MGHREDLLEGAKRCLLEKGYARTTARDIVAASGTNLASIGYHYGSKEALLNAAMVAAMDDWGAELRSALSTVDAATDDPAQRYEEIWTRVIRSFATHRQLWSATFEVYGQIERTPEIREFLAMANELGRRGLAALFRNVDEDTVDEATARSLGSFYMALMSGVLAQWLIDPEHAPKPSDLTAAIRTIAGDFAVSGSAAGSPAPRAARTPRSTRAATRRPR